MICTRRGEARRSCLTSSHAATMNNELKYLIKTLEAEPHKNHSSGKDRLSEIRPVFLFALEFHVASNSMEEILKKEYYRNEASVRYGVCSGYNERKPDSLIRRVRESKP